MIARRTDVPDAADAKLKGGKRSVTIIGDPGELTLLAFGRQEHEAAVEGDEEAVAALRAARLGV